MLVITGNENVMRTWNWTVVDWNPWDDLTSRDGKNISTEELQEAIHIYKNGLPIPGTETKLTDEGLIKLIRLWKEGAAN
ncbi:hypothetical protein [Methanosarcina mazei]|nr:hypothetical protein [Methanosarcina mazei]